MASHSENEFEKMKKTHFRVKIGVRVRIKLKIGFETSNLIHFTLFRSKIGLRDQHFQEKYNL